MCDGHGSSEPLPPGYGPPATNDYSAGRTSWSGGLSRRALLKAGAAALAGGAVGLAGRSTPALAVPGRSQVIGDTATWRTAMHVHASLSEKTGSVQSQVQQAAANGFDILYVTDHDSRAYKYLFRTSYAFTPNELQYGGAWDVALLPDLGRPVAPDGGLVGSPVSPYYAAGGPQGALRIALSSDPMGTASRCYQLVNGFTAGPTGTRANANGTIVGDTWSVDVLPSSAGPGAWGDVYVTLAYHPPTGGRPGGVYRLHYRLRTDIAARTYTAQGVVGVVDVPIAAGEWTTVVLDLVGDAATLWPDVDARDHALNGTQFWATSRHGATAEIFFANLLRNPNGSYDPIDLQRSLLDGVAGTAPNLVTHPGLEYSFDDSVHINGFGGTPGAFDYDSLPNSSSRPLYPDYGPGLSAALVRYIHDSGGLASLNHPFGYDPHATRGPVAQDQATRRLIQSLLADNAAGADLLEVGYRQRAGYTLDHQLRVFDAMTRNGIWLTGSGTSDDHTGVGWADQTNNAYTTTWAASSAESDQLAAMTAGRAFVGFLGSFDGTLDLQLDSGLMGSVSVGSQQQRQLSVDVTGLPAGGAVEVVRVDVDYAGQSDPTAGSQVVHRLQGSDLQRGPMMVPTTSSCAYRVNVVDSTGAVVAFSQPCWSLQERPPTAIPAGRAAPGTAAG